MRLKLISCEILYREICAAVARSPHLVDVEFLPKGLHDIGAAGMRARVQAAIDAVPDSDCEAVLLGYCLCGNGIAGLTARGRPLVVPRGHDCITLFLGSKERYIEYFQSHPGVYFKTTGWIERGQGLEPLKKTGLGYTYEELVAKYGEEKAAFVWEKIGDYTRNYGQLTYIQTGVGPEERFEQETREEAARRGWKFEKLAGDVSLIARLVSGEWDEASFLVVAPGERVIASYDEGILGTERP